MIVQRRELDGLLESEGEGEGAEELGQPSRISKTGARIEMAGKCIFWLKADTGKSTIDVRLFQ